MKSESPWNKLAEFIERVKKGFENQQEPEGPSIPVVEKLASGGMLFSQEELGGLLLTPEDATEFRMCVDSIQELVAGRDGKISTNAVEKILQTAVLKALDINNTDPEPDFSKRIARGIQEAQTSLKRKCDTYLVRLEVQGLDPKGLP